MNLGFMTRLTATALAMSWWTVSAAGALVDLRVDVRNTVQNDLGRAQMYVEMTGPDAANLAARVKDSLAESIAAAKTYTGLAVKIGSTQTWPQYGKTNRMIDGWRMRSEIWLESSNAETLSAAVGALQRTMLLGQMGFSPSTATKTKAIEQTELEAVRAFQARAANIAGAMGGKFKIKTISLLTSEPMPPHPMMAGRVAMMAVDAAAPMPVEPGDSTVSVTASGQIELAD